MNRTEVMTHGAVAELRGISKTYFKPDGSTLVEALRAIDLRIELGQYLAIMGASGSGKSTLMNILGCLDQPTEGTYLLGGRDVSEMDDVDLSRARGRQIGFVFQAFNLISELTMIENVEVPLFYQGVPRRDRRDRAIKKLKQVGLGDRLGHRPSELSGGEQQRVAIARAVINNPQLLLADEPTGSVDRAIGTRILYLFEELNRMGTTVLIATHNDELVSRFDYPRLHLENGQLTLQSMS